MFFLKKKIMPRKKVNRKEIMVKEVTFESPYNKKQTFDDEAFFVGKFALCCLKMSIGDVARLLGVDHSTVRYHIDDEGAPSQRKRERSPSVSEAVQQRRQQVFEVLQQTREVVSTKLSPKLKISSTQVKIVPVATSTTAVSKELTKQFMQPRLSKSTVRRDMKALCAAARVRRKGPFLTPANAADRLLWARMWLRQKLLVIWSDECWVIANDHGSRWQWVLPGQKALPRVYDKNAAKVMIWGAICEGRTKLIVTEGSISKETYRDMLKEAKPWLLEQCRKGAYFQEDQSSSHHAEDWCADNGVRYIPIPWPSKFPDGSAIEPLWKELKDRVSKHGDTFGMENLKKTIQEVWSSFPAEFIEAYTSEEAVTRRMQAVVKAKGYQA